MTIQNPEGEERGALTEPSRILREVLQQENLQLDQDFANAVVNCSQASFAPPEGTSDLANFEIIFDETRKARVYVIGQLVDWLYGTDEPQTLIEIGSGGDITAALALPQTQITSVDDDPDIFLNVPNNSLPREVFRRLGLSKTMEGYGKDNIWRSKKRKLALVEKCLPNWHKSVADAQKIPFSSNTYDMALVRGPLEIDGFLGEMVRVVEPGGYIVTIMDEDYKEVGSPSAYETNRYNAYPDISMVDLQQASVLGLTKVDIPDRFRKYENLGTWQEKDGTPKAAGVVFQVFRKN